RARFGARRAISQSSLGWSYEQLWSRVDQIAAELLRRGIGRGQVVGLYYERAPEMLAALLGVLRAGAAYLPLDPLFPPERIQFMLEDSQASLVLGDQGLQELGLTSGKTLDSYSIVGEAVVPWPSVNPEDTAYIIYTSGSTGKPKGVRVPHRAVVNFLGSMAERPGLSTHDKLVAVTTLSFDIAVLELLLPLTVGAEIILAERDQAIDGNALAALLVKSAATCMQATPATWRLLLETDWHAGAGFKALCGGEALPVELAEGLLGRVEELWNMYGPTETTVWSTCGRVEFGRGGITIGRPIANTSIYIMDAQQQPVPIGAVGEIYIGGEGVALGYHNRQALNDDKFVPDPFSSRPGAKLYRTGDLGRYRNDGELLHLGRTDFQVKVRGYRIELGEIEVALAGVPGVRQAVVVAKTDASGASNLVAYVSLHPGSNFNWSEAKNALRERLPDYMVPSAHVVLDRFPTTPNGKIDRKALPEFHAREVDFELSRPDGPRTPAQRLVADVWMSLLGVSRVSLRDNFLDLGGHSLLVMRAAAQLEARTGKRVGPRAFIFETLEQVASHYADVEQPLTSQSTATPPGAALVKPSEARPNNTQKVARLVARALSNLVRRSE
ncbi:MAG: amino acid adenylation domain-containing protein, partial [Myxococcales bacterium]